MIGLAVFGLLLILGGRLVGWDAAGPGVRLTALGVVALTAAVAGWFGVVPRVGGSWRYAEREQDLLVSRGRLLRRLTVVPY